MKKIIYFILTFGFLFYTGNCQKKEEDKKGRNLVALLLLSRSSSLGSG